MSPWLTGVLPSTRHPLLWLVGLGVWFLLRGREVLGSNPRRALVQQLRGPLYRLYMQLSTKNGSTAVPNDGPSTSLIPWSLSLYEEAPAVACGSMGMILALGTGGPGFKSQTSTISWDKQLRSPDGLYLQLSTKTGSSLAPTTFLWCLCDWLESQLCQKVDPPLFCVYGLQALYMFIQESIYFSTSNTTSHSSSVVSINVWVTHRAGLRMWIA